MEIFNEVVELTSAEERAAYLDRVCGTDRELRGRVEGLLEAHDPADSFLESPAAPPTFTTDSRPLAEGPGMEIGAYKLLETIGEGGMGVVYMAEQSQPVRRKVALKIIKPGMDSRQIIARFEAERQALALMDHPNIARVLDAGATDSGRPYFVMELVRGIPITDYCDHNHLAIADRLELFVLVCQAVQHAHQKGVIHRDLKPSNVLVTMIDGVAVPKVIDFGVAKAMGQQLTEKTLFTGFAQLIGTPLYMSPEQAVLSGVDIDTRSDIYSLGVLLYELLTGTTPFDAETFRTAGYDEIRRIICEQEPPKPSTQISILEATATTISANRQTDPHRLRKTLLGELDWIVMKCLDKDRNRRYETANTLVADLRRYLKDEPVEAGPPSAWYRLRKFGRRNRAVLAVVAGLFLALTAVAGSIGWAVRDRLARKVAVETEARGALTEAKSYQDQEDWLRATAAARRAAALLGNAGSAEIQGRVQQVLNELKFLEDLEEARLKEAEVRDQYFDQSGATAQLAGAFRDYGLPVLDLEPSKAAQRIAGSAIAKQLVASLDYWASHMPLGADQDRLFAIARAADHDPVRQQIREAILQNDHRELRRLAQDPKVVDEPATTVVFLSKRLVASGLPEALDLLRRAQQQHPADFWINHDLAQVLADTKPPRLEEAVGFYRAALALRPRSPGVHLNFGNALQDQGKLVEAEAAFREAIHLKPDYAEGHHNLGKALQAQGKLAEAEAAYREAIRLWPDHAPAHRDLAIHLRGQGNLPEAEAAYREAIRLKPDDALYHFNLGNILRDQGKLSEAEAAYREAIRVKPDFAMAHDGLGELLCDHKRDYAGAITAFREAIRLEPDDANCHGNLGNALSGQGKVAEAEAAYREAIRLKPDFAMAHNGLGAILCDDKRDYARAVTAFREAVRLVPDDALYHFNLGNALRGQDKLAGAEAAYREAIRLKPDYAAAHLNLGTTLHDQGKLAEAEAAYREAIRLKPDDAAAHSNLGATLRDQGKLGEAEAAFRKAIRLRPDHDSTHFMLGHVLKAQGRIAETLAEYREALRLKPNNANHHNRLAWLLATCADPQFRDSQQAVALAKRAVQLAPQDGASWNTLGVALYRAGEWKAAIAALEKVRELEKSSNSFNDFFQAMAHWQLGEKEKARQWCEKAVEWMDKNDPKNEELRRFQAEAEELLRVKAKTDEPRGK
jgi:tetratricopeptide (TPR) repeat protein/serine/threonine protein kinase